jgi:hypothetical protein
MHVAAQNCVVDFAEKEYRGCQMGRINRRSGRAAMMREVQSDSTGSRAARSGGAVNCTHATTQDNAAAAVRMLLVRVSSPVFRSDSNTHSTRVHAVLNEISHCYWSTSHMFADARSSRPIDAIVSREIVSTASQPSFLAAHPPMHSSPWTDAPPNCSSQSCLLSSFPPPSIAAVDGVDEWTIPRV